MPTENPYETQPEAPGDASTELSTQQVTIGEFSEDTSGNISLTSKIVKIAAVFAAFASLSSFMQVWAAFRFYGFPNGWTTWHTLICLRILYAPCWLLLAWTLWQYGKSLDQLRLNGIRHTETTIEQQAKLWLAIGLLIFALLVGVVVSFGRSLAAW